MSAPGLCGSCMLIWIQKYATCILAGRFVYLPCFEYMDFPESATAGVGKRVRDTTMRASAPEDADIAVQTMRNVYVQVRQLAARDVRERAHSLCTL